LEQYSKRLIERELHKCFVGFSWTKVVKQAVATGNWGCGNYRGDPELKFFIQWIAASHWERPGLAYYTADDEKQALKIESIIVILNELNVKTVGSLYQLLMKYYKDNVISRFRMSIFEYLDNMQFDKRVGHGFSKY